MKEITALMMGTDADEKLLDAAAQLARHFRARLAPMQVVELPEPPYNTWAIFPDPGIDKANDALRQHAIKLAKRADQKLSGLALDAAPVRLVEALYASPWEVAANECFCTDLVMAAKTRHQSQREMQGIATLILESGRPILVMPVDGEPFAVPKRIVVAWSPVREACRAVHDALPFLRDAESVEVLACPDDVKAERPHVVLCTLVEHLHRYGVKANPIVQEAQGIDIASLILAHAKKVDADMVIAGGYGHSRFREWALGGVTRELLLTCRLPALLSH